MKNKLFVMGILAFVLVFGMAVVGCDDGSKNGNDPQTVSYESKDAAGNTYNLTVTENVNRAVYSAQTGDSYELKIIPVSGTTKVSKGIIQSVSGGNLTCMPTGGTEPFNVTLSNGNMTGISGNITLVGGETETAPTGNLIPIGNSENQPGEDKTFDPQQLVGKWQTPSWETLLPPENELKKVVGFEYLQTYKNDNGVEVEYLFKLVNKRVGGGEAGSWFYKDKYYVKHNMFYSNYQTTPLFSCSISGDTLTLTAITESWSRDWDIKAGEVFFVGKKVEKYDWEN